MIQLCDHIVHRTSQEGGKPSTTDTQTPGLSLLDLHGPPSQLDPHPVDPNHIDLHLEAPSPAENSHALVSGPFAACLVQHPTQEHNTAQPLPPPERKQTYAQVVSGHPDIGEVRQLLHLICKIIG